MAETMIDKTSAANSAASAKSRQWRRPRYTVREESEHFTVVLEVPGVTREGLDISLEQDLLTIEASRAQRTGEGWRTLHREIPTADFRLSLKLNIPVAEESIAASLADGILTLTLPKADEVKPRRIAVE